MLEHLLKGVSSPELPLSKLSQGADGLAFGLMLVSAHPSGRTKHSPLPLENAVTEQGWQGAQQIELMVVGIRSCINQPGMIGE